MPRCFSCPLPAVSIVRALFLHFHLAGPPARSPIVPPGGAPSENECRGITIHPRPSFLPPSLFLSLASVSRCAFRLIPLSDLTNPTSDCPPFFHAEDPIGIKTPDIGITPAHSRRFSPFTLPWVTRIKWTTRRGRKIRGFFFPLRRYSATFLFRASTKAGVARLICDLRALRTRWGLMGGQRARRVSGNDVTIAFESSRRERE